MNGVDLSEVEISFDETHHIYHGKPLYNKRFKKVMSFHPPGVAAVEDESGAYHIDLNGNPIYPQRYLKTYGFYEGIATVVDEKGYFHIDIKGKPIHSKRFAWAGNFQEGRCAVRDFEGFYYHINRDGKPAYPERYRYVGDFKYGIAVVYNDEGFATHIDKNGKLIHGKYFLGLGVYHKGYAIARDSCGSFHIDKKGRALYSRRFAWVENFYNDFAFARLFDGRIVIIDTKGDIVKDVADYNSESVMEMNRKKLMAKLVGFWQTQILYSVVRLGILDYIRSGKWTKEDLREAFNLPGNSLDLILNYLTVNNMVTYDSGKYEITPIGRMLTENCKKRLKYAALMWGEEHYITIAHLIKALKSGKPAFPDIYGKGFFEYLEDMPEKNRIYQEAMKEYSLDYDKIIAHFEIPKFIKSIADVGGGHGTLLKKIKKRYPHISKAIIYDLPKVIESTKSGGDIELVSGDFFDSIPFKVDAILLSRVLHDWDDEKCVTILRNIRNALNDGGFVYVIETIVPETLEFDCGVSLNFNLLVMVGGRERKLSEFLDLFSKAGFELVDIKRIGNDCSPSIMVLKKRGDSFE